MKQLIQIESIPIKLDVKTTWARFEKRDPLSYLNSPAQNRNISSYQNIGSMRCRNISDVYENSPTKKSYADMLSYAAHGNDNSTSDYGSSGSDYDYVTAAAVNSQLKAVQSDTTYGGQEHFIDNRMSMYEMDRANFDMNVSLGVQDFEFVPASVEFTVSQRPEVRFEYLGSPIYVPPSADPEYVDTWA